jgi:hypothetical protein
MQFCDVLVSLTDPSGDPVSGAIVSALLSAPMVVADALVMPTIERSITGEGGSCQLKLLPNSFGSNSTTYTVYVLLPGSLMPTSYRGLVVPALESVTLESLIRRASGGEADSVWDDTAVWRDSDVWSDGPKPKPHVIKVWADALPWNDDHIWSA